MRNKHLTGNLFTKPKAGLGISEASLSASIAEYLDRRRIYNDRLNSGAINAGRSYIKLCKKGTPDRFAIVNGRIIFIEVKKEGKEPSADQLARHEELRAAGAIVLTVDSFDSFLVQFKQAAELCTITA